MGQFELQGSSQQANAKMQTSENTATAQKASSGEPRQNIPSLSNPTRAMGHRAISLHIH
jgi:hypothetical protein